MGFPKDKSPRLYRERDGGYLCMLPEHENGRGFVDAIANEFPGPKASLSVASVDKHYPAAKRLKRVEWADLPEDYKRGFAYYLTELDADGNDIPFDPRTVRGFWKINSPSLASLVS